MGGQFQVSSHHVGNICNECWRQRKGRREKETSRRSRSEETRNDASPKRKATSRRQGRRSQSICRRRCSRRKERNDQNQRAIGGREKDLPFHQNQTPRC